MTCSTLNLDFLSVPILSQYISIPSIPSSPLSPLSPLDSADDPAQPLASSTASGDGRAQTPVNNDIPTNPKAPGKDVDSKKEDKKRGAELKKEKKEKKEKKDNKDKEKKDAKQAKKAKDETKKDEVGKKPEGVKSEKRKGKDKPQMSLQ